MKEYEVRQMNLKMRRDKYEFIKSGLDRLQKTYEIDNRTRMIELLVADALTGLDTERD